MGEIGRFTFILCLGIPITPRKSFDILALYKSDYYYYYNGVEYRNSDLKRFMQIHTLCKNLVNFGPVTPEFKRVKVVHPLVDQQLGNVAPLLGYAAISTEF